VAHLIDIAKVRRKTVPCKLFAEIGTLKSTHPSRGYRNTEYSFSGGRVEEGRKNTTIDNIFIYYI